MALTELSRDEHAASMADYVAERAAAAAAVALDARHQARPHERRYRYAPFADVDDQYRYGPETIESVLSDYTLYDIAI